MRHITIIINNNNDDDQIASSPNPRQEIVDIQI